MVLPGESGVHGQPSSSTRRRVFSRRNRRANEDQRRAGRPAERGCRFKGPGGPPPSAGWPARADRPDSNSIIVVAPFAGAGHPFLGHLFVSAEDPGFEPPTPFGILGQESHG